MISNSKTQAELRHENFQKKVARQVNQCTSIKFDYVFESSI